MFEKFFGKAKDFLEQAKSFSKEKIVPAVQSTILNVSNKISKILNKHENEKIEIAEVEAVKEEIKKTEEVHEWCEKVENSPRKAENQGDEELEEFEESQDDGVYNLQEPEVQPKKFVEPVKTEKVEIYDLQKPSIEPAKSIKLEKIPKADRLYTNELARIKLQEQKVLDYLDGSRDLEEAKTKLEEYKKADDDGKFTESISKQLNSNSDKKLELESKISKIQDEVAKENKNRFVSNEKLKGEIKASLRVKKYDKYLARYDKKIEETEDKLVRATDLEEKNKLDILLKMLYGTKKVVERIKSEIVEESTVVMVGLQLKKKKYIDYIMANKEVYDRVKTDLIIYKNIEKCLDAIKNIDREIEYFQYL